MSLKEQFLMTYNHPTRVQEAASMAMEPIGTYSPVKEGPTRIGTWFKEDPRNEGGLSLIE